MLLDPFEEQLYLPAAPIQFGDGERGQCKVVGQKHQAFARLGVYEIDSAQRGFEFLARVEPGEHDALIADQAGASVHRPRITTLGFEVGLGARHKEAPCLVQAMQALEIDVTPIHDVGRARFGQQQVQQRVQFDCSLGRPKRRPGKHRQTQVDGAGIQCVDRLFQVDAKWLLDVKTTGNGNERLGKVGLDAPVSPFVGIGKRAARHPALDTHVVELVGLRSQARFDIAQAFAVGQLGERHAQILIEARERFEDRKSTRLNSSHSQQSRMPSSA